MKSIYFGDHTWVELEQRIKGENPLVILPVGMFEEHGRHCAVSLDTELTWNFCEEAAMQIQKEVPVMLLPSVWTGYHGMIMAQWPGSIRLEQETLYKVVYDICASLIRQGFRKIAIINGHGQNPAILELVVRRIIDDFNVMPLYAMPLLMLGPEGSEIRTSGQGGMGGHADELETSLLLNLRPDLVNMDQAVDDTCPYHSKFVGGDTYPSQKVIKGSYWSSWEVQKTHAGALGNPLEATAEKGAAFKKLIMRNFLELLKEYYTLETVYNVKED